MFDRRPFSSRRAAAPVPRAGLRVRMFIGCLVGGGSMALAWVWPAPEMLTVRAALAVAGAGHILVAIAAARVWDAGDPRLTPGWCLRVLEVSDQIAAGLLRLFGLGVAAAALVVLTAAAHTWTAGGDVFAAARAVLALALASIAFVALTARLGREARYG